MSNRLCKPKKTSYELVEMMRDCKGIRFNIISEKDAAKYFRDVNNYLRTACYRKNFQKYYKGQNEGKYIDLEFAYLVELSSIDKSLRFLANKMCLDVEHCLKVRMLTEIEDDSDVDGYQIVGSFIYNNPWVLKNISRNCGVSYTNDLVRNYFTVDAENKIVAFDDCPLWVFLEVITFGDFLAFFQFFYDEKTRERKLVPVIKLVKTLRNGCAHNNCLLSDLHKRTSVPPVLLAQELSKISSVGASSLHKKMQTRTLLEFSCLLFLYKEFVDESIAEDRVLELKDFVFKRIPKHENYFKNNQLLVGCYRYICEVVIFFFD